MILFKQAFCPLEKKHNPISLFFFLFFFFYCQWQGLNYFDGSQLKREFFLRGNQRDGKMISLVFTFLFCFFNYQFDFCFFLCFCRVALMLAEADIEVSEQTCENTNKCYDYHLFSGQKVGNNVTERGARTDGQTRQFKET